MPNSGILIASDEKLEWLLPWWWSRYSAHNTLPVAFVDLGLSYFGRSFCEMRGKVIDLTVTPQFSGVPKDAEKWEELFCKQIWENRKSWFKKPFALLSTPFERTLWLDIDCEVLRPLDSLFEREGEVHLAKETVAARDRNRLLQKINPDEILYNSGVVLYDCNTPLLKKWAQEVLNEGNEFCSDQHVLSRIIYRENSPIHLLEEEYNWRMTEGLNLNASIIHWAGIWGKEYIRLYGGLLDELATFPSMSSSYIS
jgi:hypothetical protein